MFTCPVLSSLPHVRHGFFGREGGVSSGLYASLNGGYGSGDDVESVAENRRRIAEKLGAATPLNSCFQIHSATVVKVDKPWSWKDSPEADAMVSDQPNIPLAILTADCLPVLFADREKPIIAAAHAGWKGALGGVLEATLDAMRKRGASNIIASIGPAIAQDSYEVGVEFYDHFITHAAGNTAYFKPSFRKDGHYYFDLPAYAKNRLMAAGVEHVSHVEMDTCSNEKIFFSYRRATLAGKTFYGRQIAAIFIPAHF